MKVLSIARSKLRGLRELLQFDNWPQLVANRLLFFPSMDVYTYRGLEIVVDRLGGDVNGIRDCLATPMYRQFLHKMAAIDGGPLTVVDLGGNAGGFPLLLKAEGFRLRKLVVAELNPQTYRRLVFNVERNLPEVETIFINEAVSSGIGEIELYLGRGSAGDSIKSRDANPPNAVKQRIPTTTIDQLFEQAIGRETVNICKIDIESAEWDIFFAPGCERIRRVDNILMEIHSSEGRDPAQLVARLTELGFDLASSDRDVYWFRNKGSPGSSDDPQLPVRRTLV